MSKVIDADGHVFEDMGAIAQRLPDVYDAWLEEVRKGTSSNHGTGFSLFPPLDHFHSLPMRKRGAGRGSVGQVEWSAFLDEVDIQAAVLYPSWALGSARITESAYAIALARAYNDWISETYARQDSRLRPMAILPLQEPSAAAEELHRAVEELGCAGAALPSHGLPTHLGSAVFEPVYAAANELDCPLAVHGALHSGFGYDDMNVFAVAHALGHPFGQAISFGALVMNGVFDRHPNLRFCFLEGGLGWLLLALERLPASYETHIPLGDAHVLSCDDGESLRAYLVELFETGRVFVGCEGEEELIPQVIEQVGHKGLMYATDFPHEVTVASCAEALKALQERPDLDDTVKADIAGGNAARFYKVA